MTRRTLLTGGLASAGLAMMPKLHGMNSQRRRALRFAHVTDVHIMPERRAADGFRALLDHLQAVPDAPEFVIFGGDQIHDAFAQTEARSRMQFDLWAEVTESHLRLPARYVMGNHDIWGWNLERSRTTGEEPRHGKAWAREVFGMESDYYAFEAGGWKLIVLDSTHPRGTSYVAQLDEPQFEWLEAQLAATPRAQPVLVASHAPILSASAYFDGNNEESGDWRVPGAWMHIDARRIKDLFHRHPNVKAAISGHIHLVDRVDYLGVSYYCLGAASGGWWGGNYQEFGPGYSLIDLYDDGTVKVEYVEFGWEAES